MSDMDSERYFAPHCMSPMPVSRSETLKPDVFINFKHLWCMEKPGNAIWSRSVQEFWCVLCSGPVWWRRRWFLNINNNLCNGGRAIARAIKRYAFDFFTYIYIYICMHLCIYASLHVCIYVSIYLPICLPKEWIKAARSEADDSSMYIHMFI